MTKLKQIKEVVYEYFCIPNNSFKDKIKLRELQIADSIWEIIEANSLDSQRALLLIAMYLENLRCNKDA